ncbi:HAD family hydrolase [Psychromonas sp. CNPT3]|uniref:HAD-IIB family hydrolase n=1 Tax=Psychromonas sp. CNPT3 TaxID=314282 RepID=UPI00006E7071|nr:HAD-IIB family hydrolase [Psychromonas sp. CNPT3]AGH80036.1 HAD family hydrolase [Psychromonas sp. CNPT3]
MPKPLAQLPITQARNIKWLFTDVDDTLTWQGKLPPQTFLALEKLSLAGIKVVPVTGACAGWCDQIAKLWPVHGVIGENGAFWMQKRKAEFVTKTTSPLDTMKHQQGELIKLLNRVLTEYPDIRFAYDQPFRYCDVAINLSQDREPVSDKLSHELLAKIKKLTVNGQRVNASLSSIHLNAWVGKHNKRLSTEQYLFDNGQSPPLSLNEIAYIGDSLNDETMFAWLPTTFGVKNIEAILPQFKAKPAYISTKNGGYGFVELAELILQANDNSEV